MELNDILRSLEYQDSPNFLRGSALESDLDFRHVFRKAQEDCGLRGVYVLNGSAYEKSRSNVPIVYVCEAGTEEEARSIHKKVWNQNAVPFLLVNSPKYARLYPGFQFESGHENDPQWGAIKVLEDFSKVASELSALRASSVDNGDIWKDLGREVTPQKRVDWRLLDNLRDLGLWLQREGVSDHHLAHSIIGKFVYLYYLRHRDILSDKRLSEWGIDPAHIFGHQAKMSSFIELIGRVDEFLNGSVFPLSTSKIRELGADRLRKVASVFKGEHAISGQIPLFDIYDFSFIPIETLSVIYEQFLHSTLRPSGASEGEAKRAYYTPVPVVNFMLDWLDAKKPLQQGMRVLDPSCGSGAFLVQCYRKLVEKKRREQGRRLRPVELGHLLIQHIYGVDIDEDACQIAELSLSLTLLDYVNPPDLTGTVWKLPGLRNRNIFHADAFDDEADWYKGAHKNKFDWIVGNPPWKDLKPNKLDSCDEKALAWMNRHKDECPVGGNQIAEAFAWRVSEVLDPEGSAALLLPAMTLFKDESTAFRKSFLNSHEILSIANFANLSNVLFAGRATLPAAAFFYSSASIGSRSPLIETYSPMLANQPLSRISRSAREVWSLVVNSSEICDVERSDIVDGQALPWKLAMWGSRFDGKVLRSLQRRFETVAALEASKRVRLSQGPEFIPLGSVTEENSELHNELIGKNRIITEALKNRRFLFRFPVDSIRALGPAEKFLSKRAGIELKLSVCAPPHVIVGASRNFAIYSEDFIVVPSRQVGITSPTGDSGLLKALALYLNSDFVAYHQFLMTPEAGVQKTRSTLRALRNLPIPFDESSDLTPWMELYSKIEDRCRDRDDFNEPDLIAELNELAFKFLKLSTKGRAAVHDLVKVRFGLTRGKTAPSAVGPASSDELSAYARMLRDELDGFVGPVSGARHRITLLPGADSAMAAISLVKDTGKQIAVTVLKTSDSTARQMMETRFRLLEKKTQWLYFNRNLRVYDPTSTYIFKPLQHLHWTQSQAIEDAGEIIGDALRPDSATSARQVIS